MRLVPWFQLKNGSESQIWLVTANLLNNSAYETQIFTPASGGPMVKEHFKANFRFGIKIVVAKQSVIG